MRNLTQRGRGNIKNAYPLKNEENNEETCSPEESENKFEKCDEIGCRVKRRRQSGKAPSTTEGGDKLKTLLMLRKRNRGNTPNESHT